MTSYACPPWPAGPSSSPALSPLTSESSLWFLQRCKGPRPCLATACRPRCRRSTSSAAACLDASAADAPSLALADDGVGGAKRLRHADLDQLVAEATQWSLIGRWPMPPRGPRPPSRRCAMTCGFCRTEVTQEAPVRVREWRALLEQVLQLSVELLVRRRGLSEEVWMLRLLVIRRDHDFLL